MLIKGWKKRRYWIEWESWHPVLKGLYHSLEKFFSSTHNILFTWKGKEKLLKIVFKFLGWLFSKILDLLTNCILSVILGCECCVFLLRENILECENVSREPLSIYLEYLEILVLVLTIFKIPRLYPVGTVMDLYLLIH